MYPSIANQEHSPEAHGWHPRRWACILVPAHTRLKRALPSGSIPDPFPDLKWIQCWLGALVWIFCFVLWHKYHYLAVIFLSMWCCQKPSVGGNESNVFLVCSYSLFLLYCGFIHHHAHITLGQVRTALQRCVSIQWLIVNRLVRNQLICNRLVSHQLISNRLVSNQLICNRLVSDQ